jgi:hypothetical protein
MTVSNNEVFFNTAQGIVGIGGGGGILATQFATRTTDDQLSFDVINNEVEQNNAFELGGGIGVFAAADADAGGTGVPAAPADARVFLANNLVAANTAGTGAGTDGTGGGVSVLLQAFGNASAVAEVTLDTIASNLADGESGGIHVESNTGFEDTPVNEGLAQLIIDSSIVADNEGFAVGGPQPGNPGFELPGGTGNLEIISRDNVYFGNHGGNQGFCDDGTTVCLVDATCTGIGDGSCNLPFDPELTAALTQTGDSTTIDPMLDTSFVSTLCDRVGHPRASALPDVSGDDFVDGIDVLRIAVAFMSDVGEARYNVFADIDGDGTIDGNDLALATAFGSFATGCP